MVKKLLILRSEKIFFKGPSIYRYLAKKFGRLEKFEELNKKYQAEKIRGPLLLEKTWNAVLNGVEKGKLIGECIHYSKTCLNPFLGKFAKEARVKGYKIASFSSSPKIFFLEANNNLGYPPPINYPYGVVSKLEKGVIIGFQDIKFHNENYVKKEMKKLGFKKKFTSEPNRYGMLGQLIELMREKDFTKENTVLIGNSVTAEPQMKLAGKVIKKFDDLNKVLKQL